MPSPILARADALMQRLSLIHIYNLPCATQA